MSSSAALLSADIRRAEEHLARLIERRESLGSQNAGAGALAPAGAGAAALARGLKASGPSPHRSLWVGPHADKMLRVNNVLDVLQDGLPGPEGEVVRLSPCEKAVLLLVARVIERLVDFRGTMSPRTMSAALGEYSERAVQLALGRLEGLHLVTVEREGDSSRSPVKRILLAGWLLAPRRPRRLSTWLPPERLSTGSDKLGKTCLPPKKTSEPILTHQEDGLDEPPLPPTATTRGVAPAAGAALTSDGTPPAGALSRDTATTTATDTAQGVHAHSAGPAVDGKVFDDCWFAAHAEEQRQLLENGRRRGR